MIRPGHKFRVGILLAACMLVYLCVFGRLFWVQIMKSEFFVGMAAQQYLVGVFGANPRGTIFDRHGQQLVLNKEIFSAFVLPNTAHDRDELLNFLHQYYPPVLNRILNHPERYFFWLERRLTPERHAWLKEQNLNGIQFATESVRYYPYKELAHVLGFTDIDNHGIAGLELALNKQLAGEATKYRMAKDARAKRYYFERTTEKEGVASDAVHITIDHKLQFLLYQDLAAVVEKYKAKQGAIIVLDPFSGEILSMASFPSFDPHELAGVDLAATKNIAVTECYEIGSVLKTVAALAALEEGVVDFDEIFDCKGKVTFMHGLRVENWKSLGVMPFYLAVKNSSNVAMAEIGLRLGEKLYTHLMRMGFGRKTCLGFPGERAGFVNPPRNWSKFSPMVLAFGYEATETLLQVARTMAIIANGGHYVEPFLVKGENKIPTASSEVERTMRAEKQKLYSEKSLNQIDTILEMVGNRYPVPGFKLKGKTGTARMVIDGAYSTTKHTYTFAGYVAKDDYRRVVVTFIKEPEKAHLWASDVAAPLAQKVVERLAIHDFNKGTL